MINYCGSENNIKNAILVIEQEGFTNSLYEMILNTPEFTHTNALSKTIAAEVIDSIKNDNICIKVYYPRWRFSKAVGYFSASEPENININGYKLKSLSVESLVKLFCHEIVHKASAKNEKHERYDHGTGRSRNNPKGKENSAPFLIGSYAKHLVITARNK